MTSLGHLDHQDGDVSAISNLIKLQSKDHEEILDVIDQLRAEGLSQDLSLPQIIVCGDQSSGKSSVLEAISGLGFPTKDNLCTRFATELILRRAPESNVQISIYPDENRSQSEQDRLRSFSSPTSTLNHFAEIVTEASNFIFSHGDHDSFSKDILRVEVSGPDQPHLTLVDLPGLYHAADDSQDERGVGLVESLVLSHMHNKRSVILAVISAKSDIALQKITKFTRRIDPKGIRTMGIITKPDTLSKGSEMESSFYNLALNKRLQFTLGWHVLKNRGYEERHFSLEDRRKAEVKFLSAGIWATLPRANCGIDALRPRLSKVLRDHILSELPDLLDETQQSLTETETSLHKLGIPRSSLYEQRLYLLQGSDKFNMLMAAAVHGTYLGLFFGDPMQDAGYERRLRAVVQNRLADFSKNVRDHGEQRKIVNRVSEGDSSVDEISRSDFVREVVERMRRSRGRELPGTFNPLIISDLFFLQAEPWKGLTEQCIENLLQDIHKAVDHVLKEIVDPATVERLARIIIDPALDQLESDLRSKTKEILLPQQYGHPITYNHYFTETIQKSREDYFRTSMKEQVTNFFSRSYPVDPDETQDYRFRMNSLINVLSSRTEQDMETFAASEAIDCMQAYYKVARKKFVDDFSNLAVEQCLLQPLLTIFSAPIVAALPDDTIRAIAAEDEATGHERVKLETKAAALRRCVAQLHRLDRHSITYGRTIYDAFENEDGYDMTDGAEEQASSPSAAVNDPSAMTSRSQSPVEKFEDLGSPSPTAESLPQDVYVYEVAEAEAPPAEPDTWDSLTSTKKSKKGKKKVRTTWPASEEPREAQYD